MHVITDALIESKGILPEEIPLKTGCYEGDSDIRLTEDLDGCEEVNKYYCTRPNKHIGLHVGHGSDGQVIARWK